MAIRVYRYCEIVCDKCHKSVSKFYAYVTTEEEKLLSNLVIVCQSCEVKKTKKKNGD